MLEWKLFIPIIVTVSTRCNHTKLHYNRLWYHFNVDLCFYIPIITQNVIASSSSPVLIASLACTSSCCCFNLFTFLPRLHLLYLCLLFVSNYLCLNKRWIFWAIDFLMYLRENCSILCWFKSSKALTIDIPFCGSVSSRFIITDSVSVTASPAHILHRE